MVDKKSKENIPEYAFNYGGGIWSVPYKRLNYLLQMGQIILIITQDDSLWLRNQDDIPGDCWQESGG